MSRTYKKKRTGKHIARIERDKLRSLEKPDFTKAINFDVLENMNSEELKELEKILDKINYLYLTNLKSKGANWNILALFLWGLNNIYFGIATSQKNKY